MTIANDILLVPNIYKNLLSYSYIYSFCSKILLETEYFDKSYSKNLKQLLKIWFRPVWFCVFIGAKPLIFLRSIVGTDLQAERIFAIVFY